MGRANPPAHTRSSGLSPNPCLCPAAPRFLLITSSVPPSPVFRIFFQDLHPLSPLFPTAYKNCRGVPFLPETGRSGPCRNSDLSERFFPFLLAFGSQLHSRAHPLTCPVSAPPFPSGTKAND